MLVAVSAAADPGFAKGKGTVEGRRTLCGFHTYVGAVDILCFVPERRAWGCAASRLCTREERSQVK